MLRKDPDSRPSINQVMENPWFPRNKLFSFTDEFSKPKGLNKQILEHLNSIGLNVAFLPQELLSGENNELTASYKQLDRELQMADAYIKMDTILDNGEIIKENSRAPCRTNISRSLVKTRFRLSTPMFNLDQK